MRHQYPKTSSAFGTAIVDYNERYPIVHGAVVIECAVFVVCEASSVVLAVYTSGWGDL